MNRTRLNLYLDVVSTVVISALTFTGGLLVFVLPSGTGGRNGGEAWRLWGWNRHDWGDVHFYLACALVALVILHVWLHWAWVCTTLAALFGGSKPAKQHRRAVGITAAAAFPLAMVVTLLWANAEVDRAREPERRGTVNLAAPPGSEATLEAASPLPTTSANATGVPTPVEPTRARPAHEVVETHTRGNQAITGQTTLAEAARLAGISAESLRHQLGLPAHVDVNERLGRLKRWHGLDIFALRSIVEHQTEPTQ